MRKWFSEKKPEGTHSVWAIKKINPVYTFTLEGKATDLQPSRSGCK
ncbi:hypothetical protein SB775_09940 [Peribacillus sp. SIMBA_075]